jgi:hypothetical protein
LLRWICGTARVSTPCFGEPINNIGTISGGVFAATATIFLRGRAGRRAQVAHRPHALTVHDYRSFATAAADGQAPQICDFDFAPVVAKRWRRTRRRD